MRGSEAPHSVLGTRSDPRPFDAASTALSALGSFNNKKRNLQSEKVIAQPPILEIIRDFEHTWCSLIAMALAPSTDIVVGKVS